MLRTSAPPSDAQLLTLYHMCDEKYDRTPMDDLAEAESEAWFEERER